MTNTQQVARQGDLVVEITDYFQLVAYSENSTESIEPISITLYRGQDEVVAASKKKNFLNYNLGGYGHYTVEYLGQRKSDKTKVLYKARFYFHGFGGMPNTHSKQRLAILGISRLSMVVATIIEKTSDSDIKFVTTDTKYLEQNYHNKEVLSVDSALEANFDKWVLVNGISPDVENRLKDRRIHFAQVTTSNEGALEPYLRRLSILQIQDLSRYFLNENINAGADLLFGYIRRQYNSILPPTVNMSGVRFAYGCISTVINKKASIGRNVTIGQNVTIGGRNGRDPIIEDDVWIGAGAVVLGSHIGKGAVIGANAVVTKDVSSGSVIVAAPTRILPSK